MRCSSTGREAGPASAELVDRSKTITGKLDQVWSDKFRTSAMYAYYHSVEPQPRSYFKDGKTQEIGANHADPGDGALYRTVHALAINNTITPERDHRRHVRLGYTSFGDDCVPVAGFDPGTLGFSPSFVSQVPVKKFPYFAIGTVRHRLQRLHVRRAAHQLHHLLLLGRERLGVQALGQAHRQVRRLLSPDLGEELQPQPVRGRYFYDGQFTSADPTNADNSDPYALAAFLLGYPSSGFITKAQPTNAYINYYAGYAQDDFRVELQADRQRRAALRVRAGTAGARTTASPSGFDRDRPWPVQVPGLDLKGGLMYAGVDGYPTHQSDPSKTKFAPRSGFAWSADPEDGGARRVRPLLGASSVPGHQHHQPGDAGLHPEDRLHREHGRRPDALRRLQHREPVPERPQPADGQRHAAS